MDDTSQPITGICLVAKPNNVPTGYQCIRKVFDDPSRDADLMADSLLERKDRFLCITRTYTLAGNRTPILEDIKLINERDPPPAQYTPLTQTIDTFSKGTSKRLICAKLVERQAGMKCICDIVFLYRTKRPPQLYTVIGEINGLQVCVKEGTVPPLRSAPSSVYPTAMLHRPPDPYDQTSDYGNIGTLAKKSDEKELLDGIPFEINAKYLTNNRNQMQDLTGLDSFPVLTIYDIEKSFNYDFNLERSSLQY